MGIVLVWVKWVHEYIGIFFIHEHRTSGRFKAAAGM